MADSKAADSTIITRLFFRLLPVQIILVAIGSVNSVIDHPSGARIINGYDRYILDLDESRLSHFSRREMLKRLFMAFM